MFDLAALRVTQAAPARTDRELVAAIRAGDDRAFEEIYARYRDRIGAYVYGLIGDHGRAEDIAQEIFISALRRLRQTSQTIIVKPWIYEIAKNACIDEFRRKGRAKEVPLEAEEGRDPRAQRLYSLVPTPEAQIESKQRLTDLRDAFRGLSESHHRILVLRELEGLSYNQIGDRLGLTKPVVESTLFRARRRLGEEFEEVESGRRCQRVQQWVAATTEDGSLRSLGIRDRRQFSRHLGDCQSCRREARRAGIEVPIVRSGNPLTVLIPGFLWTRLRGGHNNALAAQAARHPSAAALSSFHGVLPLVDPSSPVLEVGRLAATAAIVCAGIGAGGGIVAETGGLGLDSHRLQPPAAAAPASMRASGNPLLVAARPGSLTIAAPRFTYASGGRVTVGSITRLPGAAPPDWFVLSAVPSGVSGWRLPLGFVTLMAPLSSGPSSRATVGGTGTGGASRPAPVSARTPDSLLALNPGSTTPGGSKPVGSGAAQQGASGGSGAGSSLHSVAPVISLSGTGLIGAGSGSDPGSQAPAGSPDGSGSGAGSGPPQNIAGAASGGVSTAASAVSTVVGAATGIAASPNASSANPGQGGSGSAAASGSDAGGGAGPAAGIVSAASSDLSTAAAGDSGSSAAPPAGGVPGASGAPSVRLPADPIAGILASH